MSRSCEAGAILPWHPDERDWKRRRVGAVPTKRRIELDDEDAALALDFGEAALPLGVLEDGSE
jgi:hypothetical protein